MAVGARELTAAGIRHQLLSIWMDAAGYAPPGEPGARWSQMGANVLGRGLVLH